MKKLLLIPVFMFLTVACEDEKDDASSSANCSTTVSYTHLRAHETS